VFGWLVGSYDVVINNPVEEIGRRSPACNAMNLTSVTVVIANGSVVIADEGENPDMHPLR